MTRSASPTSREPCPDCIIDNVGMMFGCGVVSVSFFQFLKGVKSSPKYQRIAGGVQRARINAPRIAGSFAVYGGLVSVSECTLVYLRQKEDPWNTIISTAASFGILDMRQGFKVASRSALLGAGLAAILEGTMIVVERMMPNNISMSLENPNMMPPDFAGVMSSGQQIPVIEPEIDVSEESESFYRRLGRKLGFVKEEIRENDSQSKILESFDSPAPPTFEFK